MKSAPEERAAARAEIERSIDALLLAHGPLVSQARQGVGSGRRPVIAALLARLKTARAQCNHHLNEAVQNRVVGARVIRLRALADDMEMLRALLAESHEAADEIQNIAFVACLAGVVSESVGEEQRLAWWEEAGERLRTREAQRVARRMEAGNIVNLGSTNGTRSRVGAA